MKIEEMSEVMRIDSHIVELEFVSIEAADHFIGWYLDGGGEQEEHESAQSHLDDSKDSGARNVRCGSWDWRGK